MKFAKRAKTCGALNDRFRRDMLFMQGEQEVKGPLTPGVIVLGPRVPFKIPASIKIGPLRLVWGERAAEWAALSRMEGSWLYFKRVAVGVT